MPTTSRVIVTKFPGWCRICRGAFPAGTQVRYYPPGDGERRGATEHLACSVIEPTPIREATRRATEHPPTTEARQEPRKPSAAPRPAEEDAEQKSTRPLPQGFPVQRSARARHYFEAPNPPKEEPKPQPMNSASANEPYPPGSLARSLEAIVADRNLCVICQRGGPGPSHNGSRLCRSGSIASGGWVAHCSCSACYGRPRD